MTGRSGEAAAASTIAGRFGFISGFATAALTAVSFGLAIVAVPISGDFCTHDCHVYPYLDTLSQWPHDFLWQPLAMLAILAYAALMVSVQLGASPTRKLFGQLGLGFALVSAAILLVDYYVQFTVVPASLQHHETDGLALLIQYNPHGIFIALEELGYLVMSLSFLCVAPLFAGARLELAVRWIFAAAFVLSMAALATIWLAFGLDRQYRLEIVLISVCWLTLIVNGVLLAVVFRRRSREGATAA